MPEGIFCPRCDRFYEYKLGQSKRLVLDKVILHVKDQHPDHDPDWWDTHAKDHEGE